MLKPAQMPVPKEKFAKEFGLDFDDAVAKGLVFNALDACKYLGVDSEGLDKIWQPSKKVSNINTYIHTYYTYFCVFYSPNIVA